MWKQKDLSSQILEDAENTLKLDRKMFMQSMWSLRRDDHNELATDIYTQDKQINKAERRIRRNLLTHLSVASKAEISAGLTLASIVIDIERIGDYTKNITDLAKQHPKKLDGHIFEKQLLEIEKTIEQFFDQTIDAFQKSDRQIARKVTDRYKAVSASCSIIKDALIRGEGSFQVSDAVTLALYLRFLKRVGAHLYNVCTSIINPFDRIGYREKEDR